MSSWVHCLKWWTCKLRIKICHQGFLWILATCLWYTYSCHSILWSDHINYSVVKSHVLLQNFKINICILETVVYEFLATQSWDIIQRFILFPDLMIELLEEYWESRWYSLKHLTRDIQWDYQIWDCEILKPLDVCLFLQRTHIHLQIFSWFLFIVVDKLPHKLWCQFRSIATAIQRLLNLYKHFNFTSLQTVQLNSVLLHFFLHTSRISCLKLNTCFQKSIINFLKWAFVCR